MLARRTGRALAQCAARHPRPDPCGFPRASPRVNAAQVLKLEPSEGMLAITYGLLLDKHIKIRLHNNMNKAHTQVSTAATRVSLAADAANAAPAARAARFSPAAAAECLLPPTAEAAMLLCYCPCPSCC